MRCEQFISLPLGVASVTTTDILSLSLGVNNKWAWFVIISLDNNIFGQIQREIQRENMSQF